MSDKRTPQEQLEDLQDGLPKVDDPTQPKTQGEGDPHGPAPTPTPTPGPKTPPMPPKP